MMINELNTATPLLAGTMPIAPPQQTLQPVPAITSPAGEDGNDAASSSTLSPESSTAAEQPSWDGRGKGVLRKLMAGHFQGVSQLRLRINFSDELKQIQDAMQDRAIETASKVLLEDVGQELASAATTLPLSKEQAAVVEELGAAFAAEIQAQVALYNSGEETPEGDLTQAMQADFDTLVSKLESLFAERVEIQPSLEAQASLEAMTSEELQPSVLGQEFASFLTSLRETFSATLAKVDDALNMDSWLPPLSEARGRGRAHAKFLARYESLEQTSADGDITTAASGGSDKYQPVDLRA